MANSQKTSPLIVTGAAGFIGAYLVRHALHANPAARIIAVDTPEFFTQRNACRTFCNRVEILNPEELLERFSEFATATVFHMGACSNTEETRADYIQRVNLEYSQKLWQACVTHRSDLFYASSAGTYGMGEHGFSDAPEMLSQFHPLSLYAQSKHDFDRWALKQTQAPQHWAGFKFFNVYGPGEEHKGRQASMAYHLRQQILQNQGQVKLYKSYEPKFADGEQQRDFVYVGDLARALTDFSIHHHTNGIYNLGTGEARSFVDLARAVGAALGRAISIEFIEMPEKLRPQYQYFTQADLTRLRLAGYRAPFLNLENGVAQYFKEWEF